MSDSLVLHVSMGGYLSNGRLGMYQGVRLMPDLFDLEISDATPVYLAAVESICRFHQFISSLLW